MTLELDPSRKFAKCKFRPSLKGRVEVVAIISLFSTQHRQRFKG